MRRWAGLTAVLAALLSLLAAPAARAAFPGANGRIAYQTTNALGTMNAVGGDRRPLLGASGAVFAEPTWSADGQRLAFSSNNSTGGTFELYVTGAGGGPPTRLTTNEDQDGAPSWSPDGSRIAFESDRDGNPEIYVMNAAGGGTIRLTTNFLDDRAPAWSPDGTRIAFARGLEGSADIWTMTPDGGGAIPLTTDPGDETNPDWSPDGTRIAFERDGAIVVMAANGSGQTTLPLPGGGSRPAWAPDGARLLFDLNEQIYSANPDGSGVVQLTTAGASGLIARAPSWQPIPQSPPPPPAPLPPNPAPPPEPTLVDRGGDGRSARSPLLRRTIRASLTTNRSGSYTVFEALAVEPVRPGDTLRLTCRGPGCPLKRVTIQVKEKRGSLSLANRLNGARLRHGAVVQLRVTHKATTGRVTTWKIRPPKAPSINRQCLPPGTRNPTSCRG